MSILHESQSKPDTGWPNELRRTIYELILILLPLVVVWLALR